MLKLARFLSRNIQGKKILFLFILTTLVYLLMVCITIPKVMAHADGMLLLDLMPVGYNFDYVNTLLSALGPNGREAYLYDQIPVDMVYPALFGITYCWVFAYFLNKLDKLNGPLAYLCLLPMVAGLSDYLENIGIITLLTNYTNLTPYMVTITSFFSLLKSGATTVCFLVLIVMMVAVGIKTLNRKR